MWLCPAWRRTIYSVPSVTEERRTTIFPLEKPRIETNDFTIPLQQLRGRHNLCAFNMELGELELALNVEANADQWHCRMGHISPRSLDLLNKKGRQRRELQQRLSRSDVCAVGKIIHQPHPEKFNFRITMPLQLVYTDSR